MTPTMKILLSTVGLFIGGVVSFYQAQPTTVEFGSRFWIGLSIAGLAPIGAYFVGLSQRSPWDAPTLPTKTIETKQTVTDPPPATKPGGP